MAFTEHLHKLVLKIDSLMRQFDIDVLSLLVENNIITNHVESPYFILASYILPSEIAENFELVDVCEERVSGSTALRLYLDECAIVPDGRSDLKPNGFERDA